MFKHLSLKIFALLCAVIFWGFVVSLENNFYKLPDAITVQVFNQAPELALASKPNTVTLTLRSQDADVFKTLVASDFEAYVDLRTVGAGTHTLPVSVTSKNSTVSVMKVEPAEVSVELSPVREKTISIKPAVKGEPAKGFKVESVKLEREIIDVRGAENILAKIGSAKAEVTLDGTERQTVDRVATFFIYDKEGAALADIEIKQKELKAKITIVEVETNRSVGVQAKIIGSVTNGVIKSITVEPAVLILKGKRETLDKIAVLETEVIDLKGAEESFERKVKVTVPAGVTLAEGQSATVTVKVEIENEPPVSP